MGTATQGRQISYQQGRAAIVTWDVIAVSETDAAASVGYQGGETYPSDSLIYARTPQISRTGDSFLYKATVEWRSFATSDDILEYLRPGEVGIYWEPGVEQEPYNFDGDGNFVANAAGVAFDPPSTRPRTLDYLTLFQWENPSIAHWDAFRQHTNNAPVTIFSGAGVEQMDTDEVLVSTIKPLSKWKLSSTVGIAPKIIVAYTLELRHGGHYETRPNISDSGWFMGPRVPGDGTKATLQRGNFYNCAGSQLTDVALDLDGTPYNWKNLGIKCGKDISGSTTFYDPCPAPTQYHVDQTRAIAGYGQDGQIVASSSGRGQTQIGWGIKFRRFPNRDITQLQDPTAT